MALRFFARWIPEVCELDSQARKKVWMKDIIARMGTYEPGWIGVQVEGFQGLGFGVEDPVVAYAEFGIEFEFVNPVVAGG